MGAGSNMACQLGRLPGRAADWAQPAMGSLRLGELGSRHAKGPGTHLHLLASGNLFRLLVLEKTRNRGDDEPEFRWRIYRKDYPKARLRRGARFEHPWSIAGPDGDDRVPEKRKRCRFHHRRPA